jgi:FkbM family methyltransferase
MHLKPQPTQHAEIDADEKWGTYAPPPKSILIRAFVKTGLSRGSVCKWIRGQWPKRFPEVVDVKIRGVKYRLNVSDNLTDAKIFLRSKRYDHQELSALAIVGGRVFVDVGANTGYYSLSLATQAFDTIVAIEPNPIAVRRLNFNVAANDFSKKIKVIPMCIGKGGKLPLYVGQDLGSPSLHQTETKAPPIMVDSKPLLEIVHEAGLEKIDSMKVDVEGYEDQVLIPFFDKSHKRLWPKVIVVEHCHDSMWEEDVIRYLMNGRYGHIKKTRANAIIW